MAVIGKYELLSEMGAGAMGIVYRARDRVLDREVALKVMRPETQMHEEAAERFRREARACARLHHPNLVTVYDLGEAEDGVTFIAMELLEGVDFRTAVKQKAQLPMALKIDLIAQICEGLGHAHRHGIVHRDIKPSNLFLHLEKYAKILDFGIARLFVFLTGVHPFQAPFIPKRIVNDEPDRLRTIDSRFSVELEEALSKALAKDPNERFQTGEEFASTLRGILTGELDMVKGMKNRQVGADDGDTVTMINPPDGIEKDGRN
jgi:serine/threonine protein kinase